MQSLVASVQGAAAAGAPKPALAASARSARIKVAVMVVLLFATPGRMVTPGGRCARVERPTFLNGKKPRHLPQQWRTRHGRARCNAWARSQTFSRGQRARAVGRAGGGIRPGAGRQCEYIGAQG